MDLEMVLNELSLSTPAPDIPTARQWMSTLIQTIRKATSSGVKRILRTSDNINNLELAPQYPIVRWRNDQEVDQEERRFFKTLTTKSPLWIDVSEKDKDQFDLSDVWYQDKLAKGLGLVLIIDGLAISFLSDLQWDIHCLALKVQQLDENEELIDEIEDIKHASSIDHVKLHQNWINKRIQSSVIDGPDIWTQKDKLFPHLIFCTNVEEQLQLIGSQHPMLQRIRNKLFQLEEHCNNWLEGAFDPINLGNVSPESQVTLQQYSAERTFLCTDRKERLFSWHLKFNSWRIYFFPQESKKTIIIGYIGKHLRTVKYSN